MDWFPLLSAAPGPFVGDAEGLGEEDDMLCAGEMPWHLVCYSTARGRRRW
jgi:hypothetical protein